MFNIIKDIQIKSIMRYTHIPNRMAKIKFWKVVATKAKNCWWEGKMVQLLCKTVWHLHGKLNYHHMTQQLHSSAFIPKKQELMFTLKTCSHMFIASVLVTPPNGKKKNNNTKTNCGIFKFPATKRISYEFKHQFGRISGELCWVEKTNSKVYMLYHFTNTSFFKLVYKWRRDYKVARN